MPVDLRKRNNAEKILADYQSIIDSLYNGQLKQALRFIREDDVNGWEDFLTNLHKDDSIPLKERFEFLVRLVSLCDSQGRL